MQQLCILPYRRRQMLKAAAAAYHACYNTLCICICIRICYSCGLAAAVLRSSRILELRMLIMQPTCQNQGVRNQGGSCA